ncbi:cellulase family glycosylhydrolase [Serratia marcescens]|uniref:glycoside hydrolase family 5 protein n=1 Tax=Serratia marcescens TaxID=615 RepID=UPI003204C6C9
MYLNIKKRARVLCLAGLFLSSLWHVAFASDDITFWDQSQYGGNSFNRIPPDKVYFDALRGYGATWVRLSYDKWPPAQRDFLVGNADNYQGLVSEDVDTLKTALKNAHAAGLKVVIAPLTLPGMRWSQNNKGRFDDRLWQNEDYWQQSANFWRDLARELKDVPGIAAYNLINEPAPEKKSALAENSSQDDEVKWYRNHQGTPRDLPAFYHRLIKAIREVDPLTPIMVDSGWYASAGGFNYWPGALNDSRVLYSFHMYEPYAATSGPNLTREKPYQYPGIVPFGKKREMWDAQRVAKHLQQPFIWAQQHNIPKNRMVAGEFGCIRMLPGCRQYLEDVLTVLDRERAHWAFYSFREDNWDAMDYELGKKKVPWAYWQAMEKNKPDPVIRHATAEFSPISRRLSPKMTLEK